MMEDLFNGVLVAFVIGIMGVLIFCGFALMFSNGKFDYCYISMDGNSTATYRLYQHIPWQANRGLMPVSSIDEAKEQAAKLGCELH